MSKASVTATLAILGLLIVKAAAAPNLNLPFGGLLSFFVSVLIISVAIYGLRVLLKKVFSNLRNKVFFPYDDIAMLLINVVWSIPTILLAMALSFSLGTWVKSFWVIYIAVGLSMWVEVARIVRGQVMTVREMEYVQAARSLGYNNGRIIARHILPNIIGPIMVIMAANFAAAILIEAGLSFIGIGVQPPKPSWGIMLSENRNYLKVAGKAFLALAPGISIMILVLAFNLLGNGLRDAFDVKGKES
jgi:peptide/nickel transport system permease protein